MANQTAFIDIDEWEQALSKFTVSEAALLATINACLQRDSSGSLASLMRCASPPESSVAG